MVSDGCGVCVHMGVLGGRVLCCALLSLVGVTRRGTKVVKWSAGVKSRVIEVPRVVEVSRAAVQKRMHIAKLNVVI